MRADRIRYLLGDKCGAAQGFSDAHHRWNGCGGYHADKLRRSLRKVGATLVIPGRRNRKRAVRHDQQRYRDSHLIENALCRLKDLRRVAIRYDKLAANFLSGVVAAAIAVFL